MTRDSFEIRLTEEQQTALTHYLLRELQNALDAKASQDVEVDYWHLLYEQARTRTGRNAPWPDAADLTSYLGPEKVDALQARIMRTIWTDPIWAVEGGGDAANRAPYVEEFHQWKAEEERLQSVLDKLSLISLIEPRGLLEVSEGTDLRVTRTQIQAKAQTDPLTGGLLYDEEGKPQPEMGPEGKYLEAGPQDVGIQVDVDTREPVRSGPNYRILPYRDSVVFPGHARDKQEVWGYGKRFYKRYGELQRQAAGQGALYDADAIDKMGTTAEKESTDALARSRTSIGDTQGPTAPKELWECQVLLDLNLIFDQLGVPALNAKTYDGERWYVVTLHQQTQQMLRIQHDDINRGRYLPVILFPRTDRVTEGFSVIGHKLITVIEEHTAVRNMKADRSSMVVGAPIKRLQGALWDPYEQPFGPKAVIDVRAMNEIEPFAVPDVTAPLIEWERSCERTAERILGVNDIASGQTQQDTKTLGEVQMATEQSFVRMDLITRRFNEFMEDLAQIRHAIYQRQYAEKPQGEPMPHAMVAGLEGRGVSIDQSMNGQITAAMLQGAFRFKPRGSVETADPARKRADTIGLLQILPVALQMFPMLAANFQTPQAGRAFIRQILRDFRWENTQAILGSPSQDLQQTQMAQLLPMLMQAMQGGVPALPPAPMGQSVAPPMAPGPEAPQ